jgi:hypothetical protein
VIVRNEESFLLRLERKERKHGSKHLLLVDAYRIERGTRQERRQREATEDSDSSSRIELVTPSNNNGCTTFPLISLLPAAIVAPLLNASSTISLTRSALASVNRPRKGAEQEASPEAVTLGTWALMRERNSCETDSCTTE